MNLHKVRLKAEEPTQGRLKAEETASPTRVDPGLCCYVPVPAPMCLSLSVSRAVDSRRVGVTSRRGGQAGPSRQTVASRAARNSPTEARARAKTIGRRQWALVVIRGFRCCEVWSCIGWERNKWLHTTQQTSRLLRFYVPYQWRFSCYQSTSSCPD